MVDGFPMLVISDVMPNRTRFGLSVGLFVCMIFD